jgi:hypothetical protein
MDEVFGANAFVNEVIWYYRGGGVPKKAFARRHDTLFVYGKGKNRTFNVDDVRMPYSEETLERTKYKARAFRGKRVYDRWEPDPRGKHPDDVWEIQPTMPSSKERLGYPTQKPERLLERVIKASSNPTDIVLDPMCGCGTAIAVAHRLGRRWIGVDVSPTACRLMVKRMRDIGAKIGENDIIGLPKSREEIKKMQPFEFQNWVCQRLTARVSRRKTGDMGIDGWVMGTIPLQVKQSESVGRNVVDNFETAMRRRKKDKGIIVAFSFSKGAYEEVARAKLKDGIDIELKTVDELLESR